MMSVRRFREGPAERAEFGQLGRHNQVGLDRLKKLIKPMTEFASNRNEHRDEEKSSNLNSEHVHMRRIASHQLRRFISIAMDRFQQRWINDEHT